MITHTWNPGKNAVTESSLEAGQCLLGADGHDGVSNCLRNGTCGDDTTAFLFLKDLCMWYSLERQRKGQVEMEIQKREKWRTLAFTGSLSKRLATGRTGPSGSPSGLPYRVVWAIFLLLSQRSPRSRSGAARKGAGVPAGGQRSQRLSHTMLYSTTLWLLDSHVQSSNFA